MVESVIEASNGAIALDIVKDNPNINLVLLDILMPVLDGKDSKKSEALNYGADDILIKPIKEDELLKHIRYWTQGEMN